jgi:LEA14-like dessication related protein
MRKKIIAIFIAVTIIYIIFGGLIFLNIQLMKAPEILVKIEVTEINSEEAILQTVVNIYNPNGFDMVTKNLKVVTTTPDGYEVANVLIKGGNINSNSKKTFTEDIQIAFDGRNPKQLTTKILGDVGANILFIEKTIPLNIGVVISIEKLIDGLTTPSLSITIDFEDMTTEGINLSAIISVYNPNTFEIFIKDIKGEILTETGENVGNIDIIGQIIPAKETIDIFGSGSLLFEALNVKFVVLNVDGVAGAKIAGYEENVSLDLKTRINVPDLEKLLLSKDSPTFMSIKLDEKFTLRGIIFDIGLEINNSYKVDLLIKDIGVRIYTVTKDKNHLIGEKENIGELLALSGSSGYSSCEILVPYYKLLPIIRPTEWLMASVSGKVTIKGVNQSVFIEIRGYHSLHPIR